MGAQWKFINANYKKMEGYKRVAWPPASEERIVREFTPQPQSQSPTGQYYSQQPALQQQQQQQQPTQQYRASSYEPPQQQQQQQPIPTQHYQQPIQNQVPPFYNQQQPQYRSSPAPTQNQYQPPPQQPLSQQPSWAHQQQQYQPPLQQYKAAPSPTNYQAQSPLPQQQQQQPPFYNTEPQANQYNSYSQPQPQPFTQDQTDNPYQQQQQQQQQQPQPLPHDYRGGSPGIITLRRETPVSQKPAPVYNAEPAAVSYQGGSKLRGDLKWPPPEYKEAAARENEERRQLALGPVCRPRKVNRDFTTFFAKNALNSYYPTYKVPPGTQHMLA